MDKKHVLNILDRLIKMPINAREEFENNFRAEVEKYKKWYSEQDEKVLIQEFAHSNTNTYLEKLKSLEEALDNMRDEELEQFVSDIEIKNPSNYAALERYILSSKKQGKK